jgi:hypothetical protein
VAGPGGKPVSSSTQTCSLIARRTPASTQTRRPTPSRSGWACTRLLVPRDCSCRVPSAECRGPPGRPAAPFREAPWLAGAAELDVARLSSAAGRGRHVLQGRPALTRAIASTCHRDAITSGAGYAQIHDVTRAPVRGTAHRFGGLHRQHSRSGAARKSAVVQPSFGIRCSRLLKMTRRITAKARPLVTHACPCLRHGQVRSRARAAGGSELPRH